MWYIEHDKVADRDPSKERVHQDKEEKAGKDQENNIKDDRYHEKGITLHKIIMEVIWERGGG